MAHFAVEPKAGWLIDRNFSTDDKFLAFSKTVHVMIKTLLSNLKLRKIIFQLEVMGLL